MKCFFVGRGPNCMCADTCDTSRHVIFLVSFRLVSWLSTRLPYPHAGAASCTPHFCAAWKATTTVARLWSRRTARCPGMYRPSSRRYLPCNSGRMECVCTCAICCTVFCKDPRVVRHLANLGTSRPELLNVGVFESARNETSKSGLVTCIFATTNLFLGVCWELATDFQTAVET